MTTATFRGRNYIYLPGTKSLFRYTFENGKFAQDKSWGPVPYLKEGQSAGSAMAAMGEYVTAMTNGAAPTSTPMSVVAVSQADSRKVLNLQPFASSGSKNSFIPSMVSVDPAAQQIYVMDAAAGKIGDVALSLNPPQGRASSRRTSRSIGCEGTLRRSNVVGVGRRRYVGGQLAFPDTVNWPLGAQDLRRG